MSRVSSDVWTFRQLLRPPDLSLQVDPPPLAAERAAIASTEAKVARQTGRGVNQRLQRQQTLAEV